MCNKIQDLVVPVVLHVNPALFCSTAFAWGMVSTTCFCAPWSILLIMGTQVASSSSCYRPWHDDPLQGLCQVPWGFPLGNGASGLWQDSSVCRQAACFLVQPFRILRHWVWAPAPWKSSRKQVKIRRCCRVAGRRSHEAREVSWAGGREQLWTEPWADFPESECDFEMVPWPKQNSRDGPSGYWSARDLKVSEFSFSDTHLAVPGLRCSSGIFSRGMRTLKCDVWDLVPWLGIKSRPPALGVWSLSHWANGSPEIIFFVMLIHLFVSKYLLSATILGTWLGTGYTAVNKQVMFSWS